MENRNICPQPMSDSEFRRRITKLLLGDDWCVVFPISQEQVNTCAYDEIRRNYKHRTLKSYYRFLKQKVSTQNKKSKNVSSNIEDDVRRRSIIQVLEYARSLNVYNQYGKADIDKNIAWLEKQNN